MTELSLRTGISSLGPIAMVFGLLAASCGGMPPLTSATPLLGGLPELEPGVWTDISPPGVAFNGEPWDGTFTQGLALDPSNPATIYVGTADFDESRGGLYKSTNGGSTWTQIGPFDQATRVRVDPSDSQHLYVGVGVRGSTMGFWVSNDGGGTWAQPDGFTSIKDAYVSDVYDVAIDPADFNHILVASHSAWGWTNTKWNACAGVLESQDGGVTWILHPPLDWGYGHNVWFLSNSTTWLLGTQDAGFFRTTDSGDTWTQVTDNNIYHGGGQLYRTEAGTLYASCNCGNDGGVMRSFDDGTTWMEMVNSPVHTNAVFGDGNVLYAHTGYAGDNEPFYSASEKDGAIWTPYRGGAQRFSNGPFEMALDPDRRIIYSANWGNGVLALRVLR